MGRIKTAFIKRIGKELYEKHSEEFTGDFSKNKMVVNKLVDSKSKKMTNVLTGYLTKLKQRE